MPAISVIVPAYNSAKTIRETLDSVLNQTFRDLEVLVIDDGSTDDTVEVVSAIDDRRLSIHSYSNAGQSISRNRGIDRATGKYISFIDADDLWHPQKLEFQLEALQQKPDAEVAYSWTNFIDEYGNFLYPGSYFKVDGDAGAYLLLFNFLESGSNLLVRRQSLETIGGFDATMPPAEDWDLGIRLAKRYSFVCVPQPHIFYRKSRGSQSTNLNRLETACVRVVKRHFESADETIQPIERLSLGNIYKYLLLKCFENPKQKGIGLKILSFLVKAIANDPTLLKGERLAFAIFLKGIVLSILPSSMAQRWSDRIDRRVFDTGQLYRFIRTYPF